MPNENSESTAVVERSVQPETVEFTGKHLEAAFTFRANYHKQRILEKFGRVEELPPLPRDSLDVTIVESEKRFQKAYDLLRREQPIDVPLFDGELSRDYIISVADNLAWKGIESSITSSHLDEINKTLAQMEANGNSGHNRAAELKSREKDLKKIILEDNHFYRDFFDSGAAERLGLNSPAAMKKLLKKVSVTGNGENSIVRNAKGISLEIAAGRHLAALIGEQEATVGFGNLEEDRTGGDIVVVQGPKILYIDLKNGRPSDLKTEEIEQGFKLKFDRQEGIARAVVWPETKEPVADDNFRLTDPSLASALRKVVIATR